MKWLPTILVILGICLYIIWKKLSQHSKRMNDFFANAVRVYYFLGNEEAKLAALTAAKVAAGTQRKSMLDYLEGLSIDFENYGKSQNELGEAEVFIKRLSKLKYEIAAKDWTTSDIVSSKQILGQQNGNYLRALEKADPNVFVEIYPDLFKS